MPKGETCVEEYIIIKDYLEQEDYSFYLSSCDADNALSIDGRILHYVLKVEDRVEAVRFFKDVLGMKILRNEDFPEECAAICTGPSNTQWSKTMVGYGPEDVHFVLQLAYNYGGKGYAKGNHLVGITIKSKDVLSKAKKHGWPILKGNVLEAPGGHSFFVRREKPRPSKLVIDKISLASVDLERTLNFWIGAIGLKAYSKTVNSVVLGFHPDQTKIEFVRMDQTISRAGNCGLLAFSCPLDQQPGLEDKIKEVNPGDLIPTDSLDPPVGAATRAVAFRDPDGHEACFYDDTQFRRALRPPKDDAKVVEEQLDLERTGVCGRGCTCPTGSCALHREAIFGQKEPGVARKKRPEAMAEPEAEPKEKTSETGSRASRGRKRERRKRGEFSPRDSLERAKRKRGEDSPRGSADEQRKRMKMGEVSPRDSLEKVRRKRGAVSPRGSVDGKRKKKVKISPRDSLEREKRKRGEGKTEKKSDVT